MATPISEYIAVNIETAINAITTGNGFNQDLVAVRRKRHDFATVTPEDLKVLILQAGEEEVEPEPVGAQEWIQIYELVALVIDSDTSSDSVETRMSKVRDDIRKKLLADHTRGGYAIDTVMRPATPFDDGEGFTGIIVEVAVYYRTDYDDPYTQS